MFSCAKFLILMVYRQLMVLSDITMLQKRECNCRNATASIWKSMRVIVQSITSALTNSCVDAGSRATEENVN